jgi:hypothetical protein
MTVKRTGDITGTTTVSYATSDGTATAGSDYTATSGTLTFAPFETEKSFNIAIRQDNIDEATESFKVTLSNASGGTSILIDPASANVTIEDDDLPPSVSINNVSVVEGNAGTTEAQFLVSLSNPSAQTVSVNYVTVDGTASSPGDYVAATGTLTFPPLTTSALVKVAVNGDLLIEPDETFTVILSAPVNASLNRIVASGTITNDDRPLVQFGSTFYAAGEADGQVLLSVKRTGDASAPLSIGYTTTDGTANETSDYNLTLGTLRFAANETEKTLVVLVNDDALVEPDETFLVNLSGPSSGDLGTPATATVTLSSDDAVPGPNPVGDGFNARFFVRQHYHDFLNREPDAAGLQFWTEELAKCGADAACAEVKRINVSAAFFLSIEFQETGFFVYRLHQIAYNTQETLRWRTFLDDTQEIGRGVQVGTGDWRAQLESNKRALVERFIASPAFVSTHQNLSNAQYVEALAANTLDPLAPGLGGALTQAEREQLVNDLNQSKKTRADVLRVVAENAEFSRRQTNKAFVLMQYYGYLRRNPDSGPDANFDGYNFWLSKLNEFNGNFIQAELVKAFIQSIEYRKRFGQ